MPANLGYDIGVEPLLNAWSRLKPVDGYQISDQDMASPSYYGYLSTDGSWYIQKATTVAAVINYEYAAGASGYAAAWTGRAGLTYARFDSVF